jgi:trehalose/maltose hydrolase-like predicted phosphorylase
LLYRSCEGGRVRPVDVAVDCEAVSLCAPYCSVLFVSLHQTFHLHVRTVNKQNRSFNHNHTALSSTRLAHLKHVLVITNRIKLKEKSSVLSSNAIIDTTEQNCGYISSKESPSWKGKSFRLLETFSRLRLW